MRAGFGMCVSALWLFAACGGDDVGTEDAGAETDSGGVTQDGGEVDAAAPDAGILVVEVGTGVTAFESVNMGQTVPLIQGPQGGGRWGGFHVWHAVRTEGFIPRGATLRFETRLVSNNELIASQERRATLVSDGEGSFIAYGIAPAFMDCCLAADQDIIMSVEVEDTDGHIDRDEQQVHAARCIDLSGLDLCL